MSAASRVRARGVAVCLAAPRPTVARRAAHQWSLMAAPRRMRARGVVDCLAAPQRAAAG